jgi:hypothetical protein
MLNCRENDKSINSDQKQTKLKKGIPIATGQRVILMDADPLAWEYIKRVYEASVQRLYF